MERFKNIETDFHNPFFLIRVFEGSFGEWNNVMPILRGFLFINGSIIAFWVKIAQIHCFYMKNKVLLSIENFSSLIYDY